MELWNWITDQPNAGDPTVAVKGSSDRLRFLSHSAMGEFSKILICSEFRWNLLEGARQLVW